MVAETDRVDPDIRPSRKKTDPDLTLKEKPVPYPTDGKVFTL